jgi:hypothetical protein
MPEVKNIGKPCTGKPYARFGDGGQGKTCSLLYLEFCNQELYALLKRGVTIVDIRTEPEWRQTGVIADSLT